MNIYDIEKYVNKKDGLWLSQSTKVTNIDQLKKRDSIRIFCKETKKLTKKIQYIDEVYGKEKIIKVKQSPSSKGKYIYYEKNIIFIGKEQVRKNRTTMMRGILKSLEEGTLKITKLK